jgi:hypothetical protein
MTGPVNNANQWVLYAENQSGEVKAGGEYALVCAGIAQAHALLAIAGAISELTSVIADRFSE